MNRRTFLKVMSVATAAAYNMTLASPQLYESMLADLDEPVEPLLPPQPDWPAVALIADVCYAHEGGEGYAKILDASDKPLLYLPISRRGEGHLRSDSGLLMPAGDGPLRLVAPVPTVAFVTIVWDDGGPLSIDWLIRHMNGAGKRQVILTS